jgi:hypothetical protein
MNKEERFEKLYIEYWSYVYEFEVGYKDNFNPDKRNRSFDRDSFKEQLYEDGMAIKVNDGY